MSRKIMVTESNEHVLKWLESQEKTGRTAQEVIRGLLYDAMMASQSMKSLADKVWRDKK